MINNLRYAATVRSVRDHKTENFYAKDKNVPVQSLG